MNLLAHLKSYKEDCLNFGFVTATKLFYYFILLNIHFYEWNHYEMKIHPIIKTYLTSRGYVSIMRDKFYASSRKVLDCSNEDQLPIWCCWLQGEDKMPEIVSVCWRQIKEMASCHPVKLITLDNFEQFINLPCIIIDKYKKQEISPAHFSDIIRLNLLSKYGGLWIDTTVYLTKPLSKEIFNCCFISVKNIKPECDNSISGYRWCSFFMGCGNDRRIFESLCEAINIYGTKEKSFIHYLVIDYLLDLLCDEVDEVRIAINNIKESNPNMHLLRSVINEEYDSSLFSKLTLDTSIFKLTYKGDFSKTINSKKTFYSHIVNR